MEEGDANDEGKQFLVQDVSVIYDFIYNNNKWTITGTEDNYYSIDLSNLLLSANHPHNNNN